MARRRRPHDEQRRNAVAGVLAALGVTLVLLIAFGPVDLSGRSFELAADVPSSAGLSSGSPVRVSGLDVGSVIRIAPGAGRSARIVMRLDKLDRVHRDATVTIRPRLLLEGNDYVDLSIGSPASPLLSSGDRLPPAQAAASVQLDQVLSSLTSASRGSLRSAVAELGAALRPDPPGLAASEAAPRGFRRSTSELARALPSFTRVVDALRGTETDDLSGAIRGSAGAARQLADRPGDLGDLVDGYADVVGVLARRERELGGSVRMLAETLARAPRRLAAIERGLTGLDRYVRLAEPAVRAAPPALRSAKRALDEVALIVEPRRLPLLLRRLRPVTSNLSAVADELGVAAPQLADAAECISRNVVPTLNQEVPDGKLSTGRPAWQDLLHMAASLTGTSPGFDGNGGTLRISLAEGANAVRGLLPGIGPIVSSANLEGVSPRWLGAGKTPLFRPDARCADQDLPDLSARRAPGLPTGLRRVSPPRLSDAQQRRRSAILRGLYGDRSDRRTLRRLLLADVPQRAPKRPAAARPGPARRPPRGPAPPTSTSQPSGVTPAATPRPQPAPTGGGLLGAVGGLLEGLLSDLAGPRGPR